MRGGVGFHALGVDYVLRFSTNALCLLEEAAGRGIAEIAAAMGEDMKVSDLRLMLRSGTTPGLSLDQAGDVIDDLGIDVVGGLVNRAMVAAFPSADPGRNSDQDQSESGNAGAAAPV